MVWNLSGDGEPSGEGQVMNIAMVSLSARQDASLRARGVWIESTAENGISPRTHWISFLNWLKSFQAFLSGDF